MAITSTPAPVQSAAPAPAATAVAAPATPSAAPGATAEATPTKTRRPRGSGRAKLDTVRYPGEFDDKGVRINKLKEIPSDWKSTLHKPLKKSDFVDEETFLLSKAIRFEQIAAKLRKQAETIKSMGSSEARGAVKKLLKFQEGMATLMAALKAQGVDVESLLKANTASDEATPAVDAASVDDNVTAQV